MNRKLMAVSMVRNEADIIEAFVRYHCQFLDGVLILDNRSTDETMLVLRRLEAEGLPLSVIEDADSGYFQYQKTSRLIGTAFDEYKADLVLPLDADEFLTTATGDGNPRDALESLSLEMLHFVQWRLYVPHPSDDADDPCIPRRIRYAKPSSPGDLLKIIVSAQLWQERELRVTTGNHDTVSQNDPVRPIPKALNRDLRLAHFPVRSLEQIKSKVFTGRINDLSRHNRLKGDAPHWKEMFADLRADRMQPENLAAYAKGYLSEFQKAEELKPITWLPLKRMELLYTENSAQNWLRKGLENMELLALESRRLCNNEAPPLLMDMDAEEMGRKIAERQKVLRSLEQTFSWRLTSPLRLFARMGRILANKRRGSTRFLI